MRYLLFLTLLLLYTTSALAADEAKARSLINSLGCKGCHSIAGDGGSLAPALDGVGSRLDRDGLESRLLQPKELNPATMMPSYAHLPKEDIAALVDFLRQLK